MQGTVAINIQEEQMKIFHNIFNKMLNVFVNFIIIILIIIAIFSVYGFKQINILKHIK